MKRTRKILSVISSVLIAASAFSSTSAVFAEDASLLKSNEYEETSDYAINNNDEYNEIMDLLRDNRICDEFAEIVHVPSDVMAVGCTFANAYSMYKIDYCDDILYTAIEYLQIHSSKYVKETVVSRYFWPKAYNLSRFELPLYLNKDITSEEIEAFLSECGYNVEAKEYKLPYLDLNSSGTRYFDLNYTDETLEEKMDIACRIFDEFDMRVQRSYTEYSGLFLDKYEFGTEYYDNNMTSEEVHEYLFPENMMPSDSKPVNTEDISYNNTVETTETVVTTVVPDENEKEEAIVGDANKDNKLDVRDCTYIASMIAQGKRNELNINESDFNDDGKIDVRDAASIAIYIADMKV